MKDGLDRTGMKKKIKTAKNCMHWNVALPGSARLVHVLDRWPNDCMHSH